MQAGTLFGKVPRLVIIDQCQYGREFKKPTHIFTNDLKWKPRPRCKGNDHQKYIKNTPSGRVSSLGCMDKLSYYERAKIPADLCIEILNNHS